MLPKRTNAKIVWPQLGRGKGHPANREDRSLYGYLDALKGRLEESGAGLDYNHLSFEEKQAALALVEAGEARFASRDGRTLVERHSPSLIKRFLSMGTYA